MNNGLNITHRLLIDIGGTSTRVCTVALWGIDTESTISTSPTIYIYKNFIRKLSDISKDIKVNIDSVCVSFGASIDNGIITACGKMPDFIGKNLENDLSQIFSVTTNLAHDCICALLSFCKNERVIEPTGYITISTGIGCAIGFNANGFDIFQRIRLSHHVVSQNGKNCKCGRKGCLASYVDSKSVTKLTGMELHQINDDIFWADYAQWMATGIANIVKLFSLKRLIIGGGVTENLLFRRYITGYLEDELGGDGYGFCSIEWIESFNNSPLAGAFYLHEKKNMIIRG